MHVCVCMGVGVCGVQGVDILWSLRGKVVPSDFYTRNEERQKLRWECKRISDLGSAATYFPEMK